MDGQTDRRVTLTASSTGSGPRTERSSISRDCAVSVHRSTSRRNRLHSPRWFLDRPTDRCCCCWRWWRRSDR